MPWTLKESGDQLPSGVVLSDCADWVFSSASYNPTFLVGFQRHSCAMPSTRCTYGQCEGFTS